MKHLYYILIAVLLITACKNETSQTVTTEVTEVHSKEKATPPVLTEAQKIAHKNGIDHWKDVSQIDFTFNVDRGGKNVAKRSWSWKPKTGDVTMTAGEQTVRYNRASIDSTSTQADQGFINDKFWLLAPYQLVWDEGTTITVQDTATAPISKELRKKLTIVYSNEGGYTPGDAYDFYYNEDYQIDEWVFRQGNAPQASLTTTFEAYKNLEGLHIATSHADATGGFKLYFTDVKVQK